MRPSTFNGHPPADAVRVQLARILASETFANAGRLSRFLRFIVEGTLDGQSDRLKEYAVGVEVFDRNADYDPRIDSIVRVEARRLRSKLAEYYETSSNSDEVVIGLRKGSYVPYFELRVTAVSEAQASPEAEGPEGPPLPTNWNRMLATVVVVALMIGGAAWQRGSSSSSSIGDPGALSVAVLPLEHFSSDAKSNAIALRVTDGLMSELARFPALTVRSRTSAVQFADTRPTIADVARALDARFLVEGSVFLDDGVIRLDARVVEASRNRKIWVHDVRGPEADLLALQRQMAAAIAAYLETRAKG